MKVVQILPEMNAGGVEGGTLEIAARLVHEGHESIVISNGGRLVKLLEAAGSRHIAMPVHRKSLLTLLQVSKLRNLLEIEKPDILHIRSRVPGWVAWLAWRGMNPKTRPHLISTVHGFYSVSFYSAIMTKGERVIAVSSSIKDYILKNYPNSPAESIRVIPRGIDPSIYRPDFQAPQAWADRWKSEHPKLNGKITLLLPGRITRLKGHEDFFRLIAALIHDGLQVQGLIAGDTHPDKRDYLEELHKITRNLGIEQNISFLGHRSDIREIMSVCHIVCALSQQPESFGRTVLEAMALGKPVVGYDCGGVGEILTTLFPDGKCPLGDHAQLVELTKSIIQHHTAPKAIPAHFTLDAMFYSTLATYQELHCSNS